MEKTQTLQFCNYGLLNIQSFFFLFQNLSKTADCSVIFKAQLPVVAVRNTSLTYHALPQKLFSPTYVCNEHSQVSGEHQQLQMGKRDAAIKEKGHQI